MSMTDLMVLDCTTAKADQIEAKLIADEELLTVPAKLIARHGDKMGLETNNSQYLHMYSQSEPDVEVFFHTPGGMPALSAVAADDQMMAGFLMGILYERGQL